MELLPTSNVEIDPDPLIRQRTFAFKEMSRNCNALAYGVGNENWEKIRPTAFIHCLLNTSYLNSFCESYRNVMWVQLTCTNDEYDDEAPFDIYFCNL